MNITIIGAGNGGTAMAADLTLKGHKVTLLKSSDKGNSEHFSTVQKNNGEVTIINKGKKETVHLDKVTKDFKEGLTADTEVVVIFLPTTYQKEVISRMIPYLHDDQIILLEPGYLSTMYFMQQEIDAKVILVEAQSSPMDCRIIEPGVVEVYFKNYTNPIGIFPKEKESYVLEKLSEFKYNFTPVKNVIEAALHNPNLIVHTIGGIMSIPRIDYTNGEYWMYKEVFSSHIWNLIEKLDDEKMNVMERLGLPRMSYLEACNFRNSSNPQNEDALKTFQDYAKNSSVKGPDKSDSRYITEDVPEGLVLLESLGKYFNIEAPVCSSLITIASACMNTDFRENGRTIDELGLENFEIILKDSFQ